MFERERHAVVASDSCDPPRCSRDPTVAGQKPAALWFNYPSNHSVHRVSARFYPSQLQKIQSLLLGTAPSPSLKATLSALAGPVVLTLVMATTSRGMGGGAGVSGGTNYSAPFMFEPWWPSHTFAGIHPICLCAFRKFELFGCVRPNRGSS